jgi:hypothetical protein
MRLITVSPSSNAVPSKKNELRLACFDKAVKSISPHKALPDQTSSQRQSVVAKKDSLWRFDKDVDQFSDRKTLYMWVTSGEAQFSMTCHDDSMELGMSLHWASYGGSADYIRVSLRVDTQKPDTSEWRMWNEGQGATHLHESSEDFDRIVSELKRGKTLHTRVWAEHLQPIDNSFTITGFEKALINFETQCRSIRKE